MGTATGVRLRTHAKVNLFLRVLGRRPDGYHEVETILHVIDLADEIEVSMTSSGGVEIEMSLMPGLRGKLPRDEDNIVSRVADRLLETGVTNGGVLIRVRKGIPIGGGLGGGSGNAGGVLVALNELWAAKLDRAALFDVAGRIGSDVPYCLEGGTALATSRGEKMTRLPAPEDLWFVLGAMDFELSTKDMYEAMDDLPPPEAVQSAPLTLALGAGDVHEIASLLRNDLEIPAFSLRPDLAGRKQALIDAGALGACMTGSGPTLYGLAKDELHARAIAGAVRSHFDRVFVVSSRSECIEWVD